MKTTFLLLLTYLSIFLCLNAQNPDTKGTFTDPRDNKTYKTVRIGNQIWMAENLAYLPSVSSSANGSDTEPYYYVYNYEGTNVTEAKATANYAIYGVLYNWAAAMNGAASSDVNPSGIQGVCPSGWHLPSDAEWSELTDYLTNNGYGYEGSGDDIGKSMAAASGWTTTNDAGDVGNDQASNNSSGFNAFPGGFRYIRGSFCGIENLGCWWRSTEQVSYDVFYNSMYFKYSMLTSYIGSNMMFGRSVRCVRDL